MASLVRCGLGIRGQAQPRCSYISHANAISGCEFSCPTQPGTRAYLDQWHLEPPSRSGCDGSGGCYRGCGRSRVGCGEREAVRSRVGLKRGRPRPDSTWRLRSRRSRWEGSRADFRHQSLGVDRSVYVYRARVRLADRDCGPFCLRRGWEEGQQDHDKKTARR
jgi:hypothetical protein